MTSEEYNEQFTKEELETEIWKDVPDWVGLYQISNLGRVKSLSRTVPHAYSNKLTITERILKANVDKTSGCSMVAFSRNGTIQTRTIHQLVLLSFLGPCPDGMECCHNDGKEWNNRLKNLRYDTHKSNMADKIKHGTVSQGESQGGHKLTNANITKIKKLYSTGKYTQSEIGKMFGVYVTTISAVLTGRRWAWHSEKLPNMKELTCLMRSGEHNGRAKLTEKDVREIRVLYGSDKYSQKELSEMYCISDSSIYNIIHNISWKHHLKE